MSIVKNTMSNAFEIPGQDPFFIAFQHPIEQIGLPERFTDPFGYEPHPLCVMAAGQVQDYLASEDWKHNFGLVPGKEGTIIGKMFGVLVVRDSHGAIGFLAAFSGKMGGKNHYPYFVPPVFDGLKEGSFLNDGMIELTRINEKIKELEDNQQEGFQERVNRLKELRRDNSNALQDRIYENYSFLNSLGEEKKLKEIFKDTHHSNPPGGAGECAAPKLLQYAFQQQLEPIAMAEFWWGQSPKSGFWKHQQFYPSCTHKCEPILEHMLAGLDIEKHSSSMNPEI